MEIPHVSRAQIDFPLLHWIPRTYFESSKGKKKQQLEGMPHVFINFVPGHTHVDVFLPLATHMLMLFSTKVERTWANVISMKFLHGALTNQLWLKVRQNLNSSYFAFGIFLPTFGWDNWTWSWSELNPPKRNQRVFSPVKTNRFKKKDLGSYLNDLRWPGSEDV